MFQPHMTDMAIHPSRPNLLALSTPFPPSWPQISVTPEGVEVGAAVTLTRLMRFLKDQIAARPAHETETFCAVVNQLRSGGVLGG